MSHQLPTFVVAGAARAGSTAVIEALRKHPDVFVTQPKEPHYFAFAGQDVAFTGPDDDTTINRVAVTDEDRFRALFPTEGYVALGEGSVSTLYYHDDAVPRLVKLCPDVRVVLVLREPVARAYSSHQYLLNRGSEPEPDFLAAVALEARRVEQGWHHLWHYTAMSRYADGVAHLVRTLGRDQVRVWWYDELDSEPARVVGEMQAHIGVRPFAAEADRVNSSGAPKRAWMQNAMQTAARRPALRTAVKAVVPFRVRERIRNANLSRSDVPAEVRAALAQTFSAELTALEDVLGRKVPASWR